MKLAIENSIVRKNIEMFKIILKRALQKKTAQGDTKKLFYPVWIHKTRGEIRFSELDPLSSQDEDWQQVLFDFVLGTDLESFECLIENVDKSHFSWQQLQPQAASILKETVKMIQFIARFLPRIKSLPALLSQFAEVNLDSFLDELDGKDLIHEAWHQIDRLDCEDLLLKQASGTFLFRKDPYAAILEEQLSLSHHKKIRCITLSYVDFDRKVWDLTLVQTDRGWLFYDDDPTLEGPIYPSSHLLLDSLKGALKKPFLHDTTADF